MRLRKVIWVLLFLSLVMVIINFASGLVYDCKVASQCNYPYNRVMMELSSTTNAHGAKTLGTYPAGFVCCNYDNGGGCTGTNTLMRLSAPTNAHAEITSYEPANYNTNLICYKDLSCIYTSTSCSNTVPLHPIGVVSLSNSTNAHLQSYSTPFPGGVNICCENLNEPAPAETCEDLGLPICVSPACCTGGTTPGLGGQTCCNTACTQPESCESRGYECGEFWDSCGNYWSCPSCGLNHHCDNYQCEDDIVPCVPKTCLEMGAECGSPEEDRCEQTLSCGNCNPPLTECSGYTCVPVTDDCLVTSAFWSNTTAKEGNVVYLNTTSKLACNGFNMSFEIKESDTWPNLDDDILPPAPVDVKIGADGSAIGNWTAQWQNDTDGIPPGTNPPEYYFTAKINTLGVPSMKSTNMLEVSYNPSEVCTERYCFDYKNAADCTANRCEPPNPVISNSIAPQGQQCGIQECANNHSMWIDNCGCFWYVNASAPGGGTCGIDFDWNSCGDTNCGDNITDVCEACDGTNLTKPNGAGTWSCADFGFSGGTLRCDSGSCDKFNFSSCTGFSPDNNGKVDFRNETCDGTNLTRFNVSTGLPMGIWSCINSGVDQYDGGNLSCENGVLDFGICTCTALPSFKIGNCLALTGEITECDNPLTPGFLTFSWNGLWAWDPSNGWGTKVACEGDMGVGTCVNDSETGLWYHDPENKRDRCKAGGISTIECPAELRLPFFGAIGIVLVALIITMIYLLSNKRRKKVL